MREIKFRGMRVDTKEWVYGYYVMIRDGETGKKYSCISLSYDHNSFDWHEVIPETVGQFVREDMHQGKKTSFFDGDIVLVSIPYDERLYEAEIFYDASMCAFRARVKKDNGSYIDNLTVLNVRQVIGNVHDNKELNKE
jgi:uncharacterized phage protein (TIGR01671 family)